MEAIRTVFFDFGNVIAYFSHERAAERLAAHTECGYEKLIATLYRHDRFIDLETGLLDANSYVSQVYEESRLRCSADLFRAIFADIFTPNPDVCHLIPQLAKTHRLVLASNTNELHADLFRRTYDRVFAYFHHLVMSHEVKARKPNAAFYARCQERAGWPPSNCLFIDDRADNIAAAQAHGWQTIHYVDFKSLRDRLREFGVYNEKGSDSAPNAFVKMRSLPDEFA